MNLDQVYDPQSRREPSMNRERKHRDAATGQFTTAEDAAARPGETVAEAVPERHETPDVAELRRLAEAANGLPAGSEWLHGEVADGNETVAEWMDKCSAHPDELAAGRLWLVWSEGSGTKVIIQAIVGDTETAPLRAAFMANANPAAVLGLLNRLAHITEARDNARAEVERLAAKVERVRALPAKHPAGGWYMTSMRDVLAALDEEPQP